MTQRKISSSENVYTLAASRSQGGKYSPSSRPTGTGGGGGGMDRVIKLEHEVETIKENVSDIKVQVSQLMKGGVGAIVLISGAIVSSFLLVSGDIKQASSNLSSDIKEVSANERRMSESTIKIKSQLDGLEAKISTIGLITESALKDISEEIAKLSAGK